MNPDLHDSPVPACGLHHRAALADDERQRLLDVHVLPRLARVDCLEGVPIIRRADDHGVEVLQVEQPAIVGEAGWRTTGLPYREVDVRLVDVAHGDDLRVGVRKERVEHLVAAVPQADEPEADAIVGSEHSSRARRSAQPRGGCALPELPTSDGVHDGLVDYRTLQTGATPARPLGGITRGEWSSAGMSHALSATLRAAHALSRSE